MKQAKVLTHTELKRLLKIVQSSRYADRNRVIVLLSYLAGLRACEIAALKVGDVMSTSTDGWEIEQEIR